MGIEVVGVRIATQQSVFTILNINKSQRGYRGKQDHKVDDVTGVRKQLIATC